MAADIIKMKGSDGKVQYPVTSSEAVGMSDGSGNLDKTLATLGGETPKRVSFCKSPLLNRYIKELYISSIDGVLDPKSPSWYIERIIRNADNTCAIQINSSDKSDYFLIQSNKEVINGYSKGINQNDGNKYLLECIINFDLVTESWSGDGFNAEDGKLLDASYNLSCSPFINSLYDKEAINNEFRGVNNKIDFLVKGGVYEGNTILFSGNDLSGTTISLEFSQVEIGTGAIGLYNKENKSIGYFENSFTTTLPKDFEYAKVLYGKLNIAYLSSPISNKKLYNSISDINLDNTLLRLNIFGQDILLKNKCYLTSGGRVIAYDENPNSFVSELIKVNKGDKFLFTGSAKYQGVAWVVRDTYGTVLSFSEKSKDYIEYTLEIIEENAATIQISSIDTPITLLPIVNDTPQKSHKKRIEELEFNCKGLTQDVLVDDVKYEEAEIQVQDGGNGDIVARYDETKSKIYYNNTNLPKKLKLHGKANPYITDVLLYAFSKEKPAVGVELTDRVISIQKEEIVDTLIVIPPNTYLFVNGFANKIGIYNVGKEHTVDILQNRISSGNILYGKKYSAAGDSFTEGTFINNVDDEGRVGKESPEFYDKEWGCWKTYAYWIAKNNNMTFYDDGISGSIMHVEYAEDGSVDTSRHPFAYQRYMNVPKDSDYLTLMFGLNEYNIADDPETLGTKESIDDKTWWGAWNKVLKYYLTEMPFCKIGIIISDAWMQENLRNATIEIAKWWGIPYLDLKGNAQIPLQIGGRYSNIEVSPEAVKLRNKAFQQSDSDSHPNPKAHKNRSTIIENFLRSL